MSYSKEEIDLFTEIVFGDRGFIPGIGVRYKATYYPITVCLDSSECIWEGDSNLKDMRNKVVLLEKILGKKITIFDDEGFIICL